MARGKLPDNAVINRGRPQIDALRHGLSADQLRLEATYAELDNESRRFPRWKSSKAKVLSLRGAIQGTLQVFTCLTDRPKLSQFVLVYNYIFHN